MSVSSIGIQTILPKTGTSSQSQPQQQANDRDANDAAVTADDAPAKQAPPPPGVGEFVDKSA
jgi:hypothetical protein